MQCPAACPWVLLQTLRWHGKGTLRVTSPACQGTVGREHTHGWLYPRTHGHSASPSCLQQAAPVMGHCGRGCCSSLSKPYLVRAAARGLFLALHHFPANAASSLPLSCHAPPPTTILARLHTCVCPHRARPSQPPVPHVPPPCQPPASPRPCWHSPSPRIRAAGGDAWRLQSVESCQPQPHSAAWVPSAWGAPLWPLTSTELPGRSHRAFGIK